MKRHYVFIERKALTPNEVVHPTLSLEECKICDDPTCELRELFGKTTIGLCEAEEEDLYALLVSSNDVFEPKTMLVVDYFEKKAKLYVGETSDLEELKLKVEKAFRLIKKKEVVISEIEDLRGGAISKSRRQIDLNYNFITYDNDE